MANQDGQAGNIRGAWNRIRAVFSIVLFSLLLIITLQNMESVQTNILFLTIELPRAVLLAAVGFIGFLVGMLVGIRRF